MLKLIFFVPEANVEAVKQAVFDVGAGRLGDYDHCSWQALGTGQFRPLEGANPHLGDVGAVERVDEYRVETLVDENVIDAVIEALIQAHPYEEPAWEVVKLWRP